MSLNPGGGVVEGDNRRQSGRRDPPVGVVMDGGCSSSSSQEAMGDVLSRRLVIRSPVDSGGSQNYHSESSKSCKIDWTDVRRPTTTMTGADGIMKPVIIEGPSRRSIVQSSSRFGHHSQPLVDMPLEVGGGRMVHHHQIEGRSEGFATTDDRSGKCDELIQNRPALERHSTTDRPPMDTRSMEGRLMSHQNNLPQNHNPSHNNPPTHHHHHNPNQSLESSSCPAGGPPMKLVRQSAPSSQQSSASSASSSSQNAKEQEQAAAAAAAAIYAMEDQAYNPAKLFVGGLGQQSTEASLSSYFSKFGIVKDSVVIADRHSGRSRGFGFVVFENHDVVDQCLTCRHDIDGVSCEVRRAVPRDEARGALPYDSVEQPGKVYVGGLPETITEAKVREYFSSRFGPLRNVTLMYDKISHRPRGFGFIVFENYKDAQASWGQHPLLGRTVEAKKAEPKPELRRVNSNFHNNNNSSVSNFGGRQSSPNSGPKSQWPDSNNQQQMPPRRINNGQADHYSTPYPTVVVPQQQQYLDNWTEADYHKQSTPRYNNNSERPTEQPCYSIVMNGRRNNDPVAGDPYGYGALAAGSAATDYTTTSSGPTTPSNTSLSNAPPPANNDNYFGTSNPVTPNNRHHAYQPATDRRTIYHHNDYHYNNAREFEPPMAAADPYSSAPNSFVYDTVGGRGRIYGDRSNMFGESFSYIFSINSHSHDS